MKSRKPRHDGQTASPEAVREVVELREEIRRAHEVLRDLRRATKEADSTFAAMRKEIRQIITGTIKEEMERQLEELTPKLRRQIDLTVRRINEKFESLERMIFGRRAPGDPTLEETIARGVSNGRIPAGETRKK
jgi:DNA anti-recombination protein RmuC